MQTLKKKKQMMVQNQINPPDSSALASGTGHFCASSGSNVLYVDIDLHKWDVYEIMTHNVVILATLFSFEGFSPLVLAKSFCGLFTDPGALE